MTRNRKTVKLFTPYEKYQKMAGGTNATKKSQHAKCCKIWRKGQTSSYSGEK